MRTTGLNVFLVSTWDLDKPEQERAYFRTLTDRERFKVMGHDGSYWDDFGTCTAAREASGNAYAVPMLAVAVLPLVKEAVMTGVVHRSGPRKKTEQELLEMIRDYDVTTGLVPARTLKRRKV